MEPRVQYSADGRWFWDGAQWRPVPAPAPTSAPGPPRGMFWFFKAPEWVGPYVLMALIGLIPFVGHMVILGWMAEARDNARRGWGVVPPAGFRYLERGFRIWVVQIVYTLVALAVIAVCVGIVVMLAVGGAPWYGSLAAGLALGALSVALVLAVGFLFAAQVDVTDRYGIATGIDPANLWRAAVADSRNSWQAFGAVLLGWLILTLVGVTIGLLLPFASFFVLPAVYLMPVPALADFDETRSFAAAA